MVREVFSGAGGPSAFPKEVIPLSARISLEVAGELAFSEDVMIFEFDAAVSASAIGRPSISGDGATAIFSVLGKASEGDVWKSGFISGAAGDALFWPFASDFRKTKEGEGSRPSTIEVVCEMAGPWGENDGPFSVAVWKDLKTISVFSGETFGSLGNDSGAG